MKPRLAAFERLIRLKEFVMLRGFGKKDEQTGEKKSSLLSFLFFW